MKDPHDGKLSPRSSVPEDRLREVIDVIPGQVWSAMADGSVDFVNKRWQDYTGLTFEEALGFGGRAAVHPEDLAALLARWPSAVAAGQPFEMEARIRRADGEYRWFLIRSAPLRDAGGRIVKWYGTS